jgi:CDP-diacylglycerol---serine O-phosphatidyltransferase
MKPVRASIIGERRGITLRQVAPNAVTAMALCFGLTGVRFAISGEWEKAVGCIILAGVLDGLDGRIARLLRGESRFGAELDSLSDSIAFGVSPAFVLYLWSLSSMPKFGWLFALAHALTCALRLARFNAAIDTDDQPHKSAGFMTGVPAPTGAGLAMLPLYLWLATDMSIFREWYIVAPWMAFVAILMISSIATFSWSALRLRKRIRLEAIAIAALLAAALMNAPWHTLIVVCAVYLAMIPFGMASYAKARSQRGNDATALKA